MTYLAPVGRLGTSTNVFKSVTRSWLRIVTRTYGTCVATLLLFEVVNGLSNAQLDYKSRYDVLDDCSAIGMGCCSCTQGTSCDSKSTGCVDLVIHRVCC